MARRDVAQNGRRLSKNPIAIDLYWDPRLRIEVQKLRAVLLVGGKIDMT
jgi:hypothetical protein